MGWSPKGVKSRLHSPRIFLEVLPFPLSVIILATNLNQERMYDDLAGERVVGGEVENESIVGEDGVIGEGGDIGGFLEDEKEGTWEF